jgi:hypothetical protein
MKKLFRTLFGAMLLVMALLVGVDVSMATAATTVDTPQSGTPDPDTKALNTDLTGTPATEKNVKDSDINDDEIDDLVDRFRAFNYSLSTDIDKLARQKQVKDYQVKHAVMATPVMDCTLQYGTSQCYDRLDLTIGAAASNKNISSRDQRMFGRSQTVTVVGVPGYKWNGTANVEDGQLMLKVIGRDSDNISLIPINGAYSNGNGYTIPALNAGQKLQMMATAGHTAQLVVSPKSQYPVLVDVTLQKKIMNTMIEKEWKEKKKKVPFFTDDIENNALMTFRQENERTKLMGVGKMLTETDEQLGTLNCYYEEGVISQLLMKYVTNGTLTYADIVAMQKMQFGKWSMSNEAEVYCSYGFIEQLLNLDFTKVAQTNILATQSEFGVDITKFKSSFGTFNFKLCPILDEMGFENCAMVIDMKNAIHYWKKPNVSEKSNEDLSKGGVEPIEANRDRYIKIDCFCLRGYNSMLVGPADKIFGVDTVYSNNSNIYEFHSKVTVSSNDYYLSMDSTHTGATYDGSTAEKSAYFIGNTDVASGTAPTELKDGLLIYLHDAALTFNAGDIIVYDASTTSWKKYSGMITA